MHDIEAIRAALLHPDQGFVVLRGFYAEEQLEEYREECAEFLRHGKVISYKRIVGSGIQDYYHPGIKGGRTCFFRIYQFPCNHSNDVAASVFEPALAIRNEIEEPWTSDDVYAMERNSMADYVLVNSYVAGVGSQSKHRDYFGPATFPFLQFLVLLSKPNVDYRRGNLLVHTRSGNSLRVETDLDLQMGDAFVFDKSLLHEVEKTRKAERGLGRWTALIGARAFSDRFWRRQFKRWIYGGRTYPVLRRIRFFLKPGKLRGNPAWRPTS